ncbi:MAG: hypothetical protein MJB12_13260, partial [Firmicutes bacterium]|nr:hypothetical protein [Bacillota bacterium]
FAVGDAGTLKRDYQIFINMTANGIEDWPEEKMLELCRMGYWEGTKSTNSVLVKSISKNLFDKDNLSYPFGTNKFLDADGIPRTSTNWVISDFIKVKPNEDYRFTNLSSSSIAYVCFYRDGVFISSIVNSYAAYNYITTPSNANQLKFSTISGSDGSRLDIIQLEEGTTATPYVEHDFSKAYVSIPFNDGELTRLLNGSVDSVDLNSGIATQRNKKYVLQSGDIAILQTGNTNNDYVEISYTNLSGIKIETDTVGTKMSTDRTVPRNKKSFDSIDNVWTHSFGASVWLIFFPKGTYANLAAAQADLAGTELIYQLAQEQVYDINITPLRCFPNGTMIVEPWQRMVLDGKLAWGFRSDHVGFKRVEINISADLPTGMFAFNEASNQILIKNNGEILPVGNTTAKSDVFNILDSNVNFVVSLDDTDTGWAESYTPTPADIKAYFNACPYILEYSTDPSQTILPTISYKSPTNAAAQRDSNTNAIAQLSDIVAEHDLIVAGQKNEVQQPEYSGMLTQNKPVFSVGTGYDEQGKYVDVGDSVVKGQVSVESIKGLTISNLVQNGNVATNFISDTTGTPFVIQPDGTWRANAGYSDSDQTFSLISGNKYFFYCRIKDTSVGNLTNRLRVVYSDNSIQSITPGGSVDEIGIILTAQSSLLANLQITEASAGLVERDYQLFIPMTDIGIEGYTAEQMLEIARQGHWSGTKSTNSVRAKSIGKNLFDVKMINTTWFAGGEPLNHEILDISSSKISVKGNNSGTSGMGYRLKVKPNTTYVFSCEIVQADVNGNINISSKETWYGRRLTYHASSIGEKITKTFTTGAYETELNISFNKYGGDNNINILENIQLEEGSTATDYAKHEFSEMYVSLPDDVDALHSLPNGTKDEVSDNKLYKRISEDYTITSDLFKALVTSLINVDLVLLDLRNQAPNILKSADIYKVRMQNSSEVPITSRDNVENIGKFYAATGTTEGSIYLIIAKGQYPNLATAQANIINDYSLTTLTYQLAQEKQYDMNITPLTCYPNGTIIVESWNTAVLKESDIASIHTSAAEADVVALNILDKQQVVLGGSSTIGNFEINGWDEVPVFDWDVANIVGKFYISAVSGVVAFIVPKGTYANLAAAQAGLAGIVVQYVTDPSQTTLPTISYKAPINAAAQRDSNTNAVAQLSDIVAEHDLILLSIAAGQK